MRRRRLSSDDRLVRRTEQRSRLAAGHRHRRRVAALTAARTARSYQSDILARMETAWCDIRDWAVMSLYGKHRINLYPVGSGGPDPDLSFTGEGTAQNRRDPSTKAESEDPSPGSVTRLSWVTSAVIGAPAFVRGLGASRRPLAQGRFPDSATAQPSVCAPVPRWRSCECAL